MFVVSIGIDFYWKSRPRFTTITNAHLAVTLSYDIATGQLDINCGI